MTKAANLAALASGPIFAASANAAQSISAATATKVTFGNEFFDTNSNFASNRFTPNVAGYYQINSSVFFSANPSGIAALQMYKNGFQFTEFGRNTTASGACTLAGGTVVYANGSTDYFEMYAYSNAANSLSSGSDTSYVSFSAFLIRAT